jgi:hypothetical protein
MAADFSKYADNSRDLARDLWRKLRAVAAHVPFAEDAVAIYYCSLDRATPVRVRMAILGALAYFVLPTDAIPDFCRLSVSPTTRRSSPQRCSWSPPMCCPSIAKRRAAPSPISTRRSRNSHGRRIIFPFTSRRAMAFSASFASASG